MDKGHYPRPGLVADLFAGPGGWDVGARQLGLDPIGFELDADACATRAAAGLRTIRADLDHYRAPAGLRLDGLIGSPPCPAFSAAGTGEGRTEIPRLIEEVISGRFDPAGFSLDARLVLVPFRWVAEHEPRWVALEQVPPVLPVWEAGARWLARRGYRVWAGVLCAADYGVPQTRRRAVLIAHADRLVAPPAPTHAEDPTPTLFDEGPAPWVSMAAALGLDGGVLSAGRDWRPDGTSQSRPAEAPAPTLTSKSVGQWILDRREQTGPNDRSRTRTLHDPAPTVTAGTTVKQAWQFVRPATTIACDSRVWPPGHKVNQDDIDRLGEAEARARYGDRAGTEAIRITVEQAAALQSFPPRYPFQGSKGSRARQVGNAVPPLLAEAILRELVQ